MKKLYQRHFLPFCVEPLSLSSCPQKKETLFISIEVKSVGADKINVSYIADSQII